MTSQDRPRLIATDTSIAADHGCRAFWGATCEQIGNVLAFTPTAERETARRIGIDTERVWKKNLKALRASTGSNRSETEIRRIATTAAQASKAWFRRTLTRARGSYRRAEGHKGHIVEREGVLEEAVPEGIFDLLDPNGERDRNIVIEALARDYEILLTHNQRSVKHQWLKDWIEDVGRPRYGVESTILLPAPAFSEMRRRFGKPEQWMVETSVRAAVTDGYDEAKAADQVNELLENFHERGMSEIALVTTQALKNARTWARMLDIVRRHGASATAREEETRRSESRAAAHRRAGYTLPSGFMTP